VIAPYYNDNLSEQLREQNVKICLTIVAYSDGYQIS